MSNLADALSHAPDLFPHALDVRDDVVRFVRLSRADFARASFLDERIISTGAPVASVAWTQTAAAIEAARLPERCGFIFHIGHVGSTLLSRLLGGHPGVFALREPLVLRTFAQVRAPAVDQTPLWSDTAFESRLGGCLKLLSRVYEPKQLAIVKATSFVSELASELLSRPATHKALAMFVSPESYLATILGGPNSRREAKLLTPWRTARLNRQVGRDAWHAASLTEGETLALGWACEMIGLVKAVRAASVRVLPLDFDAFLDEPQPLLLRVLDHFDRTASPSEVAAILAGPDMNRYSKGPEHSYDAALRKEVLDEARGHHAVEIRRGLDWLDRAAGISPLVREAMAFAAPTAP